MDKRFIIPEDEGEYKDTDVTLIDNLTGKEYTDNFEDVVDLMNWIQDDYDLCRLNNRKLFDENKQLKKELLEYKKLVKNELQDRYELSNRKLVYKFMAERLGVELE